jgi:putative peptide zinc metalloprotease protein
MTADHVEWTHKPATRSGRRLQKRHVKDQMEALSRAPLFRDLPRSHLREIAKVSSVQQFTQGQEVAKEGAAGSVFFVILQGSARVVRKGRTLARLGPGDFFGEIAILTETPRVASVFAQGDVSCVTLSSRDLRGVLKENSLITLRILNSVIGRLADVDRSIVA